MSKQAELIRRSLTGVLIVAFTILPVIYSPWSWVAFLCIIHAVGLVEFFKLQHPRTSTDYVAAVLFTAWLGWAGYAAIQQLPFLHMLAWLPVIIFLLILLMMVRRPEPGEIKKQGMDVLAGTMYITLPLWSGILMIQGGYDYRLFLVPIFLIWINDTGAYLVGSRLGKRKIAPAISPGKTIEGTLGGALLTLVLAFSLTRIWPEVSQAYIWFLGILVPLFSLAGDLWESALKRAAGVKDSGRILPGHGGMLDRYDSFLFVLPLSAAGYFIFVA